MKQLTFFEWLISSDSNISTDPYCHNCIQHRGFCVTDQGNVYKCEWCAEPGALKKLKTEYAVQLAIDKQLLSQLASTS